MKKYIANLLLLASLCAASAAIAGPNGVYLGGGLGWGSIYQSPTDQDITFVTGGRGGLSGRLLGGYQFTPNIAAEFGYTKFSNTTVNYYNDNNSLGLTFSGHGNVVSYAIDLVAKAIVPLRNGFSLYGKLGVAGINENPGDVVLKSADGSFGTININHNSVAPTFGLGAAYDLNKEWATDLSWMRIQHVNNSDVLSTDLVTLGVIYYFG